MAKHHPDLIFCRKQAGVGKINKVYFLSLDDRCLRVLPTFKTELCNFIKKILFAKITEIRSSHIMSILIYLKKNKSTFCLKI